MVYQIPQISRVDGAVLMPCEIVKSVDGGEIFRGGVYDDEGKFVDAGIHKGRMPHLPNPTCHDIPNITIAGRHLYAGFTRNHFGNFLIECLRRLWVCAEITNLDGVIFQLGGRLTELDEARLERAERTYLSIKFLLPLMNVLCPKLSVHISARPARVETLFVGTQLQSTISQDEYIGTRAHRKFMFMKIAEFCIRKFDSQRFGKKIFVSRSRLVRGQAKFVGESRVDAFFESQGYEVIHPQTMSIEEQFACYFHAQKLVFSEGSALHLYALGARPDHDVCIITRRPRFVGKFAAELAFCGVRNVQIADAVTGYIHPSNLRKRTPTFLNTAPTILSMKMLHASLMASGFVNSGSHPPEEVSADEVQAEIADLAAAHPGIEFSLACDAHTRDYRQS